MFWVILIFVVIAAVVFSLDRVLKDENFTKIPGPSGLPIIGNVFDFMKDQVETFYLLRRLANEYKDLFKVQMGPLKGCFIYNPEDIEILISGTKYNSKGFLYSFLKPWLQEGLLLSDGEKWRQRRKMLTPAFHFNILRHFNTILVENANNLVGQIESELDNTKIDLSPVITDFTIHSICETAMGHKLDRETSDFAKSYKKSIHKLGLYILYRMQRAWLYPSFLFNLTIVAHKQRKLLNLLSSFRNEVINNRSKSDDFKEVLTQEEHDGSDVVEIGKKRLAMLDLLLHAKDQGTIDTKGICEEIDTFMFEGHDTTASALQFIFLLLANNKETQDKIIAEYTEVLGSLSRDATMNDLTGLKYLECCIKESMRLYPPVPIFSRKCHVETKFKNYTVPAHTELTVLVYDMHRRADIFPNPTAFQPERFMVNKPLWHPFAYIPFSAGPRNCIGQKFAMMEMKLAVSTVLRRFRLLPVTKPEDIVFISDFILRSRDPIYVKFEKRS